VFCGEPHRHGQGPRRHHLSSCQFPATGPAGDELHAVDRNGRPSHRLRAYRYGKRMGISTAEARERLGLRPQRMKGPGSLVSRPLTQPISTELFALSFWAASGRLFDLEARLTKFTTRLHHRCRNKKTRTGRCRSSCRNAHSLRCRSSIANLRRSTDYPAGTPRRMHSQKEMTDGE
jgi:hypothetical protein